MIYTLIHLLYVHIFSVAVLQKLERITADLKRMEVKINSLVASKALLTNLPEISDFITKYQLQLPINNEQEFIIFDNKLRNKKEFYSEFVSVCNKF